MTSLIIPFFKTIWQQIYQLFAFCGGVVLLYHLVHRLVIWFCGQSWIQRLFWANEVAMLRKFYYDVGLDDVALKMFIQYQ
ncbi:hypothetical protein KFU94_68055 [Chloroflexi bacterium TSY]|nr:hypothetical protein [Chloroflexi bacterium TSY]